MPISAVSVALLLMAPATACAATHSNLSETIQQCLNVQTFDGSYLDILSTVIVIDDDSSHSYNRDEQISYYNRLKQSKTAPTISAFEILGDIEDGSYHSITYRYILTTAVQHAVVRSQMYAHDVWGNGPSGWARIASVIRRTRVASDCVVGIWEWGRRAELRT